MTDRLETEILVGNNEVPAPPKAYWSDSRKVSPGDGFFALPGKISDGHEFITHALKRNASVVFIEKEKQSYLPDVLPENCVVFLVEDTEKALHVLGMHHHKKLPLEKTIGITGSVGKTTTKSLIRQVLSKWYPSYATRESFNTSIGIDLALLSAPEDTKVLILEFGANSFGEIRDLTLRYTPEIAIITDIAEAHTEGFTSLQGVLEAKSEITESPHMETVFFNADTPMLASFFSTSSQMYKSIPVGWHANSSEGIRIEHAEVRQNPGKPFPFSLRLQISLLGDALDFEAPFYCTHHAYACAYALGAAKIMGCKVSNKIDEIFSNFEVPPGRGNIITRNDGVFLFDESYNANPKSMESSLKSFAALPLKGKKVLLLGGMKELGVLSLQAHLRIFSLLSPFHKVFLIGEEWNSPEISQTIKTGKFAGHMVLLNSMEDFFAAIDTISLEPGDALFVKGSRSYGLERAVKELGKNVFL
ncbi:MAG TPA: UDP-N-acetylmuramoyl-tripeptide--D-alanyl-D-alanine ligase [Synergistaceae bacterium]|nr:UDP-N-acetylmuramoyl-tripeptide--D-alanyl-D-alanine ligase [Synergistaceae bacterium]HPJ25495.1 UDP-N-acetylmuramoyl-tripeptide--D-alanyl-D-alanine ligase [Synergistaceae bacterium]HPQ36221.1 UDP-N-acetylmuramoyl-tripeptide--D-alanyl-D-alanine ligase [Synergistaceae bacterium]